MSNSYSYADWAERTSPLRKRNLESSNYRTNLSTSVDDFRSQFEIDADRTRERSLVIEADRAKREAEEARKLESSLRSREKSLGLDLDVTRTALNKSVVSEGLALETNRGLQADLKKTQRQLEYSMAAQDDLSQKLSLTQLDYGARIDNLHSDSEALRKRLDHTATNTTHYRNQLSDTLRQLRQKEDALRFRDDLQGRLEQEIDSLKIELNDTIITQEKHLRLLDEKDDIIDELTERNHTLEDR